MRSGAVVRREGDIRAIFIPADRRKCWLRRTDMRSADGIPLAIELAAARVKSMRVEQIATRLNDRLRLLTGGSRTALPHQQTLRSAIDWSYGLLPAIEKSLLRRLSVFAGGWTIEAAEAVCAGGEVDSLDVFEANTRLVDKSLIVLDEQGTEPRYRMLEMIRHTEAKSCASRTMPSSCSTDICSTSSIWRKRSSRTSIAPIR